MPFRWHWSWSHANSPAGRGHSMRKRPSWIMITLSSGKHPCPSAREEVLQQLVKALQGLARLRHRSADQPTLREERNSTTENTLVCWECNRRGHRRQQCPQLQKSQQIYRCRSFASGKRELAKLVGQSLAESSTGHSKFDIFRFHL